MLKFKSSRWLQGFYAFLLFTLIPLTAARAHDAEARRFLQQFESTTLASLDEFAAGHSFQQIPRVYSFSSAGKPFNGKGNRYHAKPYAGESPAIATEEQRLFRSVPTEGNSQAALGEKSSSELRDWVLFSRCVIRSFYIDRFEANDDPEHPIGTGLSPDPLCPKDPKAYLKKATAFGNAFFGF